MEQLVERAAKRAVRLVTARSITIDTILPRVEEALEAGVVDPGLALKLLADGIEELARQNDAKAIRDIAIQLATLLIMFAVDARRMMEVEE